MSYLKLQPFFAYLMVITITCSCFPKRGMEELTYYQGEKHKGVCWVGSSKPLEGGELKALRATGANFISQTPFGWQESTDVGYCNTIDAAESPWIWPKDRSEAPLSEEVQAGCYEAFFEAVWEKPWLQGVYFWKWYPKPGGREPDFTPQNKKAQNVMKSYFNPLVLKD